MKAHLFAFTAAALSLIAGPVFAHHSFAMFDPEKTITVSGVVKEFEWTNPHVWIHVVVPDDKGVAREWGFEMQAIAQDMAGGWRPDSVKPGDKVSIEFHPLKDGTRGGQLVSAILSDGRKLRGQAARPPAPQAP